MISVITVCHNAERTIRDCIYSVLSQSFCNWELIIIDGASTDSTLEIINLFEEPRIQLFSAPDNGIFDAMNKGLSRARGELVGFLNADDFFENRDCLSWLNRYAKSFPSVGLFVGVTKIVSEDFRYGSKINRRDCKRIYSISNNFRKLAAIGVVPAHPSAYFRRINFPDLRFETSYRQAGDLLFMMTIILNNKSEICFIPDLKVVMREGGISNSGLSSRIRAQTEVNLIFRKLGLNPLVSMLRYIYKLGQFFS